MPCYCAVLKKKGGALGRLVSRFFVCDQGHMFYFKKSTDARPVGVIWLQGYTAESAGTGKAAATFLLQHSSRRAYELTAKVADDVQAWLDAIRSQCTPAPTTAAEAAAPVASSPTPPKKK